MAYLTDRITALLLVFRSGSCDTSTPEGRAKERTRRAAITTITAAIARGVALATPLVTIPLMLQYLGRETYGLWVAITSTVWMFVFADLGLGNGLITVLSREQGRGDLLRCRKLISTTLFLLSGMALTLGILFATSWPFVPWAKLFNAQSPSGVASASGVVAACTICFLINLPLATVQRTQMALQEGFQSNLWQCIGSLVAVAAAVLAVQMKLRSSTVVLAISAAPLVATVANWLWFFQRKRPDLCPGWRWFSREETRSLLSTGAGFFTLSILTSLGLSCDNMIIATLCGLEAVTVYSVPARVALIVCAVVNMVCSPMWAANGEALARGDVDWVRQNTKRLCRISLGFTVGAAVLFTLMGPTLLRLWLGKDFQVSYFLIANLGVSSIAMSIAAPYFMVLNAAGIVAPQVRLFLVYTPVNLIMKLAAAKYFGLSGVPLCNAFTYFIIVIPAIVYLSHKALEKESLRP